MLIEQVLRDKGGTVVTISPDTDTIEAAQILAERRIGLLVVCTPGGRVLGVVSERDIVRAVAKAADRLSGLKVSDLMTARPFICSPRDDIRTVMNTMQERGFRHMPVVEHGHLKGLVSSRDLLKHTVAQAEMHEQAAAWSDLDFL